MLTFLSWSLPLTLVWWHFWIAAGAGAGAGAGAAQLLISSYHMRTSLALNWCDLRKSGRRETNKRERGEKNWRNEWHWQAALACEWIFSTRSRNPRLPLTSPPFPANRVTWPVLIISNHFHFWPALIMSSAWLDLLPLYWSSSSSSFLKIHLTLFCNHLKSRWSQANRVMWPPLLNHGGGIASNHGGRSAVDQIHSCVNDHQVSRSDESLGYHSSFPWHRWIMLRNDPWLSCLLRHNWFNTYFLIMFW